MRLRSSPGGLAGAIVTTVAALVLGCSEPAAPVFDEPSDSQPSPYPRVVGTWDVDFVSIGVIQGTTAEIRAECDGRLEIDVQSDSLFSGTMLLRDSCAQFGGIDGRMTVDGDVVSLTYTVTVGISSCEIVSGDRFFRGTITTQSLSVRATHVRRCGDELTDRELILNATFQFR
jgi:hypothetical protein